MNLEQREVGFRTTLDVIKQRPLLLIFGTGFTLVPILVGGVFLLIISSIVSDVPVVDYDLINRNGSATKGTITNIEIQRNIMINNDHPAVITYSYKNGEQELYDKYKILTPSQYSALKAGDDIDIKYLGNQSIIAGNEPFVFPTALLSGILIPLLTIGLVSLGFLFRQVKNQIALYKNGRVVDAKLISMTLIAGLPISGIGKKVAVNYLYKTSGGKEVIGKSASTDYTVLSMKQDDTLKIFVSLDNESKSCLIPKLDQIRNNWKIS